MNKNIAKRLKMNNAIQNADDVKTTIDTYYRLRYEVAKLLDADDYDGNRIESMEIDYRDDTLAIILTADNDRCGNHFMRTYRFNMPIEWLFLDAKELAEAKKKRKEEKNFSS